MRPETPQERALALADQIVYLTRYTGVALWCGKETEQMLENIRTQYEQLREQMHKELA